MLSKSLQRISTVRTGSATSQVGFVLTRSKREIAGKIYLEYWVSTDSGPVKLLTSPQSEVFFVHQDDQSLIDSTLVGLTFDYKPLSLRTFDLTPVAALYFANGAEAFRAKQQLDAANIPVYEADIRLTERYLMERFVYGGVQFQGSPAPVNSQSFTSYKECQLKPASYTPNLSILSVDIECSEVGELYSIGLASEGLEYVIMIGAATDAEAEDTSLRWIKWVSDERELLQVFVRTVNKINPDIFIGWNVVNFDFRLLIQRAELHRVKLTLGREGKPVSWRDARGEVNQGYVTMPGRLVIDGIDALRTATYHFDSFSLEYVSRALLGKGKDTEDVDNRMEAINHDFKHNKVKLAKYNLQDCQLVLEIFEHTQLMQFLILRSQLTGLELDRVGGSVAAFVNLYLPKLHRAGYVSPNRPEDGGLASPGGYVMDSLPGLYKNVLVLDFKSLYPSIIRTFKIDPLGLVEGLNDPASAIPGYKGAVFSRDHHFLPDIITSLWAQRDEAKKESDTARSQAIKILMNSFYGVLGSGGCPFYDTRLASSITMRGHDIMKQTAEWIEAEGYKVIYGDTDSTFVWLEGELSYEQSQKVGRDLQEKINRKWCDTIRSDYQLDCFLEIEFETHFSRFIMPTIRGSSTGSKKRYAGIKQTDKGGVLVFKGLETVRSDWTELAKKFQTELYAKVFNDEDVIEYVRETIQRTRSGELDDLLVYRKRLRRRLDHYVKNIPPHVKAARNADILNEAKGRPLRYQHKGWISYVITVGGPEAVEHASSVIDYDHYIEKQIRPIAEAILPFVSVSFDEITCAQIGLF